MTSTILTTKTTISHTGRKSRRDIPLQVKACEIDGYGNYGCQLADELQSALPQLGATSPVADISAEEFEAVNRWYWS
jgi:hypothetical protein